MGRSRAVKPTRDQKALISAAGLEVRSVRPAGRDPPCGRHWHGPGPETGGRPQDAENLSVPGASHGGP